MTELPPSAALDAAERLAARRRAARGEVDPEFPAVRRPLVERHGPVTRERMEDAYALLGITSPETVRWVSLEHHGATVELVVVRRKRGCADGRSATVRSWFDARK